MWLEKPSTGGCEPVVMRQNSMVSWGDTDIHTEMLASIILLTQPIWQLLVSPDCVECYSKRSLLGLWYILVESSLEEILPNYT